MSTHLHSAADLAESAGNTLLEFTGSVTDQIADLGEAASELTHRTLDAGGRALAELRPKPKRSSRVASLIRRRRGVLLLAMVGTGAAVFWMIRRETDRRESRLYGGKEIVLPAREPYTWPPAGAVTEDHRAETVETAANEARLVIPD